MSQMPDSNDPIHNDPADTDVNGSEDSAKKGVRRKLRYDAPSLDIPRPLYLRSNDDPSDEDAA